MEILSFGWGNPIVEWHRIALVLQYSAEMSAPISQLCRVADAADFFQPLREPDLFLGAYEGQRFTPNNFRKDTLCRYIRRL
jgi:hypothetical protein